MQWGLQMMLLLQTGSARPSGQQCKRQECAMLLQVRMRQITRKQAQLAASAPAPSRNTQEQQQHQQATLKQVECL
jgi:hypothetical protein